jgi:hypothetical protein
MLGYAQGPVPVQQDNTSSITISEKVFSTTTKAKHLSVRAAFVKEYLSNNIIRLICTPTEQVLADDRKTLHSAPRESPEQLQEDRRLISPVGISTPNAFDRGESSTTGMNDFPHNRKQEFFMLCDLCILYISMIYSYRICKY